MACFYTYVDPDQLVDKVYMGDSGNEDDDLDDMKKKNNDMHLNKTRKGTKL